MLHFSKLHILVYCFGFWFFDLLLEWFFSKYGKFLCSVYILQNPKLIMGNTKIWKECKEFPKYNWLRLGYGKCLAHVVAIGQKRWWQCFLTSVCNLVVFLTQLFLKVTSRIKTTIIYRERLLSSDVLKCCFRDHFKKSQVREILLLTKCSIEIIWNIDKKLYTSVIDLIFNTEKSEINIQQKGNV